MRSSLRIPSCSRKWSLLARSLPGNELKIIQTARVIHLRNLRLAKQLPFAVEDMYLPFDRFPALASMDLNNTSLYVTLENIYRRPPAGSTRQVTAGSATGQEAGLLGINKGAPVMRLKRISTDRAGA